MLQLDHRCENESVPDRKTRAFSFRVSIVAALLCNSAFFGVAQGYTEVPSLIELKNSPCFPAKPSPDMAGGTEKDIVEYCLDALDGAPAEEQAFHLDAALSGLRIVATTGFQELPLESLRGAARLKGRANRTIGVVLVPDEAELERARILIDEAREKGDFIAEAHLLGEVVEMLSSLGRNDEIQTIIDAMRNLPIADRSHVQQDILFAQHKVARASGDVVSALESMETMIRLYKAEGDEVLAVIPNYSIGEIFFDLGDYDGALSRFRTAQAGLENDPAATDAMFGLLHLNIGNALASLERNEEAIREFEIAITLNERVGNSRGLSMTYFSLAKSLDVLGEKAQALEIAWRAARLAPEQRSPLEAANNLVWIAARELERDGTVAASEALEMAASLVDINPDNNPNESFQGETRYVAVNYARNMSELMERLGRNEDALRYARYALDSNSDWLESEKVQAAVDAEALFEIRNQGQRIRLLESESNLQQVELELRDAELEKQELRAVTSYFGAGGLAVIALLAGYGWRSSRRLAAMRKTFVTEEHHRTKNALQIASSLIRSGSAESVSNRLVTMGLVYDHLHENRSASVLAADPFLRELIDNLMAALAPNSIKSVLYCEIETLHSSVATPLGLLVCEILINACKYAFPSGEGQVDIKFAERDGIRTLIVSDNGIGSTADIEKEPKKSTGSGYRLIYDLSTQLGAEATLTQDVNGTRWTISPIPLRSTAA